jgi:hypothetical protein
MLGKDLEIWEAPGNHYTIYMRPNVETLAFKMNAWLDSAQGRVATGNYPSSLAER